MKKMLEIVGYLIFALIIIAPFFSDISILKTLPSYILSTAWFLIVLIIGISSRIAWALLLFYFVILAIIYSYGFIDAVVISSLALGIMWAIIIFYTNNMNKDEY